jgi:hypothetical protein
MRALLAACMLCLAGCAVTREAGDHPLLTVSLVVVPAPVIAAIPFRLLGWHRYFEGEPSGTR